MIDEFYVKKTATSGEPASSSVTLSRPVSWYLSLLPVCLTLQHAARARAGGPLQEEARLRLGAAARGRAPPDATPSAGGAPLARTGARGCSKPRPRGERWRWDGPSGSVTLLASACFPVPHTLTNKITLQTHLSR